MKMLLVFLLTTVIAVMVIDELSCGPSGPGRPTLAAVSSELFRGR